MLEADLRVHRVVAAEDPGVDTWVLLLKVRWHLQQAPPNESLGLAVVLAPAPRELPLEDAMDFLLRGLGAAAHVVAEQQQRRAPGLAWLRQALAAQLQQARDQQVHRARHAFTLHSIPLGRSEVVQDVRRIRLHLAPDRLCFGRWRLQVLHDTGKVCWTPSPSRRERCSLRSGVGGEGCHVNARTLRQVDDSVRLDARDAGVFRRAPAAREDNARTAKASHEPWWAGHDARKGEREQRGRWLDKQMALDQWLVRETLHFRWKLYGRQTICHSLSHIAQSAELGI